MKKNGFVFVESIVVLVVVALSLSMLISSYSLVSRKTKEKENYDKASDKYLLYAISNLGTDDTCNYGIKCNNLTGISAETFKDNNYISFRADTTGKYACGGTKIGQIMYDCNSVFEEMNLVHLYVVENIVNDIYQSCDASNPKCAINFYDSGTIEYMKSLKKCNDENFNTKSTSCDNPVRYMIGVFEKGNGEYQYASIEI